MVQQWVWHPDALVESIDLEVPGKPKWFSGFDDKVSTAFEKLPGQRRHVGSGNGGLFYSSGKAACLRLVRNGVRTTEKAPTKLTNLVDICGCEDLVAISDFQGQLGIGGFGMNKYPKSPDVVLKHPFSTSSPTSPLPPSETASPRVFFTHIEWLSSTSLIALCSDSSILEFDVPALQARASTTKTDEPLDLSEGVSTIRAASERQPLAWTSHITPNRCSNTVSSISPDHTSIETYQLDGSSWKLVHKLLAHDGAKVHAVHSVECSDTDYLVTVSTELIMRIWDLSDAKHPVLVYDIHIPEGNVSKDSTKICSFTNGRFALYWEEAIQLVFDLSPGSKTPKLEAWRQDVGGRLELGCISGHHQLCVLFADRLAVGSFNCSSDNAVQFSRGAHKSNVPVSPKASPLPVPAFQGQARDEEECKAVKIMDKLRASLTHLTDTCNGLGALSDRVNSMTVELHKVNSGPQPRTQKVYDELLADCEEVVEKLDTGKGVVDEIVMTVSKQTRELKEDVSKKKDALHTELEETKRDLTPEVKKFREDVYLGMISPELQGLKYSKKNKARELIASEFATLQEIEVTTLEAISEFSMTMLTEHFQTAQQLGTSLDSTFTSLAQEATRQAAIPANQLPVCTPSLSPSLDEIPSVIKDLEAKYAQSALKGEQQTMQILDEMYREEAHEAMPRDDSVMPDDSISVAGWGHDLKTGWRRYLADGKYNGCIFQINSSKADELEWFRNEVAGKKEEVIRSITVEAWVMLLRSTAMQLDANPHDTSAIGWLVTLGSELDLSSFASADAQEKEPLCRNVQYAEEIAAQILPSVPAHRADLEIAIMNLNANASMLE
eukprot:TRINITY_DN1529_c0_g2_i1.p1 TRINITY_DN1529_c0_g2~~TRINITY_DN1529_c0_g2_i1.p1  ORF type:complete len:836 (+),score=210.83 TRINITY_DN1529_c0_g2_i1:231-2738(+)